MIFGDIGIFSIEIKHHLKNTYFVRFWFNNTFIGTFNRAGKLNTLTDNYEWLTNNYIYLWEDKFKTLSNLEIFEDIVREKEFQSLTLEEQSLLIKRMSKYGFLRFDNQFRSHSFCVVFDIKSSNFKFLIYEMDGVRDGFLHSFVVDKDYFFKVYKKTVEYLTSNSA
ncbi:MAG: hypothetical protein MUE72_03240 [Chitinophagaceae bacterium]|nr:hypothetical protein [Chitinophagaceae bacterium]